MINIILTSFSLIVLFTQVLLPNASWAKKLSHEDGYKIEIQWKQKGTKFIVWGLISNGIEKCEQLNYTFSFNNSESNRHAWIEGYIKNYVHNGRNSFRDDYKLSKRSKKFKRKSDKNAWYIRNYRIKCLE
jgi:hypothetical protein